MKNQHQSIFFMDILTLKQKNKNKFEGLPDISSLLLIKYQKIKISINLYVREYSDSRTEIVPKHIFRIIHNVESILNIYQLKIKS